MKRNLEERSIILNADDIIEAIKLYCDKYNIYYNHDIICWEIDNLDSTEGNTDSSFRVQLE